jgi:hypothetical protein
VHALRGISNHSIETGCATPQLLLRAFRFMCVALFSGKMIGCVQGRSSVVEQRPFKPKVVGSIPTAPKILRFQRFDNSVVGAHRFRFILQTKSRRLATQNCAKPKQKE